MANKKYGYATVIVLASLLLAPLLFDYVKAQLVPDWVKNTAKWYGDDLISDDEFLNAIKFLVENKIMVLDFKIEPEPVPEPFDTNLSLRAEIMMPNGNAEQSNTGFFIPLNMQVNAGTTVVWVNDDNVLHTVQSMDDDGKPSGVFNSNVLKTGERFAFKFEEKGEYNYYCTIHPWRVGLVTVN